MTSRPRTRVSVQAPFGGVTDWYPEPSYSLWHYSYQYHVILVIPAEVPIVHTDPLVALEVGAVFVISPIGVLDLVDYSSSSNSDPSKDSLTLAPELPLVSPFLCSDDSEADSEFEPAEQRTERHESLTDHDAMVLRWRDRVTSMPSSPPRSSPQDTLSPSSEFPLAPVVAPPGIRRLPAILVRPGEAIPFGRPYRTHPNGPHFTSNSSSSSSSLDSLSDTSSGSPSDSLTDSSSIHSSGCDASGQSYSGPSTRVASPRLIYPSVRTPRCSESFMRWRSTTLSTLYPPTTSESSLDSSFKRSLDSSSPSAGPSRKRCTSPTTLVPSSTPVLRSIASTHVDLLPPRNRFRDSYSPEDSREVDLDWMGLGHCYSFWASTADVEAVADLGIGDGVGAPTKDGIGMGVEVAIGDIREDKKEFEAEASTGGTMEIAVDQLVTDGISESTGGDVPDLKGTLYDIAHYMSELVASGKRAGLADRIRSLGWENLRVRALLCIERDRVDSLRCHMALSQEEFRQICRDCDDTRRRLRRLKSLVERRLGFRH
ncbi:hypothetical protein Tco_0139684 [Tanacetum coccineum]